MLLSLLFILPFLLIPILAVAMPVDQLLTLLMPIIVWLCTQAVTYVKSNLPGWLVVSVIVPVLAALGAWIAQLITGDGSWLQQFLFNLLATFIHEVYTQIKSGNDNKPAITG